MRTTSTTLAPVPRAIYLTAHLVPILVLPSGLWRICLGLGASMGLSGELLETYGGPGWVITPYVIVLSVLSEGLALLTIGLVAHWGEVVPGWVPWLRGRRLPVLLVTAIAGFGAVATTALYVSSIGGLRDAGLTGWPSGPYLMLMLACYAPVLLWGPLLGTVTVAYYLRRTGRSADA